MIVIDVNVLLAAHRRDHPRHEVALPWFDRLTRSDERFTVPDFLWSSFLRISSNRRIFTVPTPLADAFTFVRAVRSQPNHLPIVPSPSHLGTLEELCTSSDAAGDLVVDAYLAAITIELGATLVSFDRDFARFERLRWTLPQAR